MAKKKDDIIFFKDRTSLPPSGSPEFDELIESEIEKCLGGVTIGGIHYPGWLYFHTNHWHIRIDDKDKYGNVTRIKSLPHLRDNEWERAEAYEMCKNHPTGLKGYMEVGLRQGGKSEFEASMIAWNALMFENTQNVVVGGNGPDLSLITDKIDFGLKHMWEGLRMAKIDKDWRKPTVRLGFKDKDNQDYVWSYIMIRNAADGNKTEAPAGTTAKCFIMDEVGKYLFAQVFEAAKPSFLSSHGLRCIPILVGTGGSFENGADAERFFYHPEANGFLPFADPESGIKTCKFMSGLYRQDCKYDTTLADYLVNIKGKSLTPTEYKQLSAISMKVSDKILAEQKILAERAEKAKDPDKVEYLKVIMYHPLTPSECFLTPSNNLFNVQAAKRQLSKLNELEISGYPVEILHDGEKLFHQPVSKNDLIQPILQYKQAANANKHGRVVIYEPPIKDAPFGLYVAGIDPYKQDVSFSSTSYGACYIYKRMHSIDGDKYQDMIVAQYVGRPDTLAEWNEIVRNLIRYYNAYALCESEDYGFIQYMINKGDTRYLMEQPDWLRDITTNSKAKRQYGIPATPKIIAHLNGLLKTYSETTISKEVDKNGSIVKEVLGFSKILDTGLLEEMISFNPDGNFDRIRAASIAIAVAKYLDAANIKPSSTEMDPRIKTYFSTNVKRSDPFGKTRPTLMKTRKRTYF